MSAERERKIQAMKRLLANAREVALSADEEAAYILNNGGDVELPKYEPGQYVMLTPTSPGLGVGHTLARRKHDSWVTFEGWLLGDDEVKAIDPALVITGKTAMDHCVSLAKQVGGILDHSYAGLLAGEALEDIYREGGLIL